MPPRPDQADLSTAANLLRSSAFARELTINKDLIKESPTLEDILAKQSERAAESTAAARAIDLLNRQLAARRVAPQANEVVSAISVDGVTLTLWRQSDRVYFITGAEAVQGRMFVNRAEAENFLREYAYTRMHRFEFDLYENTSNENRLYLVARYREQGGQFYQTLVVNRGNFEFVIELLTEYLQGGREYEGRTVEVNHYMAYFRQHRLITYVEMTQTMHEWGLLPNLPSIPVALPQYIEPGDWTSHIPGGEAPPDPWMNEVPRNFGGMTSGRFSSSRPNTSNVPRVATTLPPAVQPETIIPASEQPMLEAPTRSLLRRPKD